MAHIVLNVKNIVVIIASFVTEIILCNLVALWLAN